MNPLATNHPISYFRKFHREGLLDLSPQFQRNPVWSDVQASYLIDSVLNELPFPEIYVRSIVSPNGDTKLEVVDGQQRLRSIIRFYTNDLQLSGENVTERWQGISWEKLPDDKREQFWSYKVVVRELEGASDAEVRDMFRRLNANQSAANAQELRHAQYKGEFIHCVEAIADDPWWLENKIVTPAQVRRMLDVEYVSELLVGIMSGPLDKKIGLDEYYADYEEEFPERDLWEFVFDNSRSLSSKLVGGDFGRWKSKTEFYSLFIATARCVLENNVPRSRKLSEAVKRLAVFREKADQAKRRDNRRRYEDYVHEYAEAVTRASTDLSRRQRRIEIVQSIILGSAR